MDNTPRDSLVDRTTEVAELRELLKSGTQKMALLYGRRRIGKTFLLQNVWPEDVAFHYTAGEVTDELNRKQLLEDFARWTGEPLATEDYPTWRSVFRLLLNHGHPRPVAIVLDEFQYLSENLRALTSELNAAWEEKRPARSLVLVLSGSIVQMMSTLDEGGAPLYGRLAWKQRLRPFDYRDSSVMAPFRSLRDRIRAYAIFGGTPRFLATIKRRSSLRTSVATQILSPRGEVRIQLETVLDQERGLRDIPRYRAIIEAIGAGRTRLNEIGQRAGLPVDSTLRDKIDRLIDLDYIRRHRNLGARSTNPYRYRLADPALMFYHTFVTKNRTALERHEPKTVWDERIKPVLDTYVGFVFEQIAEQAYYRLASSSGLPAIEEWGRWEGVDRDRQSVEMDIAARTSDGQILTGAIKWNRKPLGPGVHLAHLESLDRLARSGVSWAKKAKDTDSPILYIAAGGVSRSFESMVESDPRGVVVWTLEDLFG